MRPYSRSERVGVKIQSVITELLNKKLEDPRIGMATVSGVKLSADLRVAHVYIAVFGDQKRIQEALDGFRQSRSFIRKHIAPKLGLRYMPELRFVHDDSFDRAARMDELIKTAVRDIPEDPES